VCSTDSEGFPDICVRKVLPAFPRSIVFAHVFRGHPERRGSLAGSDGPFGLEREHRFGFLTPMNLRLDPARTATSGRTRLLPRSVGVVHLKHLSTGARTNRADRSVLGGNADGCDLRELQSAGRPTSHLSTGLEGLSNEPIHHRCARTGALVGIVDRPYGAIGALS
jgi:hypothetical protein